MKLTTDIIINSLKESILEILTYPIRDTLTNANKKFYKDYRTSLAKLEQKDLFHLVDLIFINQSISVNNQTTKGTDNIILTKIGTLSRNAIYNDILILAGEKQEKLTDEEVKTIMNEHIQRIVLAKTPNQIIDISKHIKDDTLTR